MAVVILFHLHVSRYLHSGIEVQYIPQNAHNLSETISLNQSRRMRSKEVHYIDHPMIGILALITPYERPLEATQVMQRALPEQGESDDSNPTALE